MKRAVITAFIGCLAVPSYAISLQKPADLPVWDDEQGPTIEQARLVPQGKSGHLFELVISNSALSPFKLTKLKVDGQLVRLQTRKDGQWVPMSDLTVPPQGSLRTGSKALIRATVSKLPTAHTNPTAYFYFGEDLRISQPVSPCTYPQH